VLFSTTVRHSADFGPHSIILASWSKTWSFAAGWSNGTWPLLNVHGETIASSWLSNVHIRTVLVTSLGTSKSRNQKSPNCGINAYRALLRSCIWLTKTASGCCVSNRHHIRSRYVLEIRRIWVIAPCVSATFSVRTVGQVLFWQLCLFVSVLTRQWASASPAMGHWGHVPPPHLELVNLHQFGNFYLRMTPVSSGRLVVNTIHFLFLLQPEIHSRLNVLNVSVLYSCRNFCDFVNTYMPCPLLAQNPRNATDHGKMAKLLSKYSSE